MYFDTHAHYDSGAFNADREEILAALPEAGVALVVNPGCEVRSSEAAIGLAERFDADRRPTSSAISAASASIACVISKGGFFMIVTVSLYSTILYHFINQKSTGNPKKRFEFPVHEADFLKRKCDTLIHVFGKKA